MQNPDFTRLTAAEIEELTIEDLRRYWAAAWKIKPHTRLSQKILAKSLLYKVREHNGLGLSHQHQQKLDQLVRAYKRSRDPGVKRQNAILPGTRLVKEWKGAKYTVIVQNGYFEYDNKKYKSLTAVANEITKSHWNGWAFFGVTRQKVQST